MADVKVTDLTDALVSMQDIDDALAVVSSAIVKDIVKLPPALAVQLPSIRRCLTELKAFRQAYKP